jgi:hypothetical protein
MKLADLFIRLEFERYKRLFLNLNFLCHEFTHLYFKSPGHYKEIGTKIKFEAILGKLHHHNFQNLYNEQLD